MCFRDICLLQYDDTPCLKTCSSDEKLRNSSRRFKYIHLLTTGTHSCVHMNCNCIYVKANNVMPETDYNCTVYIWTGYESDCVSRFVYSLSWAYVERISSRRLIFMCRFCSWSRSYYLAWNPNTMSSSNCKWLHELDKPHVPQLPCLK